MYKNQLQELAQRSCFNLPSYSCIREGPDHAPRFKAMVNFNGESFESPSFCSTLRQSEHAAAEVALNTLASRGPSRTLAARVLDETGVYKNLLQETTHRAGLKLPLYTTVRSGPGHGPAFSCKVELAGMSFTGEPARTKKQAQKNAAMAAWSALKKMVQNEPSSLDASLSSLIERKRISEEQEQVIIARFLSSSRPSELKPSTQCNCQKEDKRLIHASKELKNSKQSNFFPRGEKRSTQFWNNFVSMRPTQSESQQGDPSPSSFPFLYQSWNFPCFSPEMAMWQSQQEHLLNLQSSLSMLQIPPRPPIPQLPFMQSIFPLYAAPRFSIPTSGPSPFCLNHAPADSCTVRSTVTIQEIQEEKMEETPKCPFSVAYDPIHEDKNNKSSGLEEKVDNFHLGHSHIAQSNAAPLKPVNFKEQKNRHGLTSYQSTCQSLRRSTSFITRDPSVLHDPNTIPVYGDSRNSNPESGGKGKNFDLHETQTSQSKDPKAHGVTNRPLSRPSSSRNPGLPPSTVPPVMIRETRHISVSATHSPPTRNTVPASSIPRPQNLVERVQQRAGMRAGSCSIRVQPCFVAPPVRIRTVIPVCSAPPAVKAAAEENVVSDMATASSELRNLRIHSDE